MITFKSFISENKTVHPELSQLGIDNETIKKFLKHREASDKIHKMYADPTKGEKIAAGRMSSAYFKDLQQKTKNFTVAHHVLSTRHDTHGAQGLYEENTQGDEGTPKLTKHMKKMTPGESKETPEPLKNFQDNGKEQSC